MTQCHTHYTPTCAEPQTRRLLKLSIKMMMTLQCAESAAWGKTTASQCHWRGWGQSSVVYTALKAIWKLQQNRGDKIAGGSFFLRNSDRGNEGMEESVEWVCGSVFSREFKTSGSGLSLLLKPSVKTLLSERDSRPQRAADWPNSHTHTTNITACNLSWTYTHWHYYHMNTCVLWWELSFQRKPLHVMLKTFFYSWVSLVYRH